jgi:hypothetical protein
MKRFTEAQRQWAWFLTLWVVGLASTTVIALIFRWVVRW